MEASPEGVETAPSGEELAKDFEAAIGILKAPGVDILQKLAYFWEERLGEIREGALSRPQLQQLSHELEKYRQWARKCKEPAVSGYHSSGQQAGKRGRDPPTLGRAPIKEKQQHQVKQSQRQAARREAAQQQQEDEDQEGDEQTAIGRSGRAHRRQQQSTSRGQGQQQTDADAASHEAAAAGTAAVGGDQTGPSSVGGGGAAGRHSAPAEEVSLEDKLERCCDEQAAKDSGLDKKLVVEFMAVYLSKTYDNTRKRVENLLEKYLDRKDFVSAVHFMTKAIA